MKRTRTVALFLSLLALPLAAHAAKGAATADTVKGAANTLAGKVATPITEGQSITEGTSIETGSGSALTLTLPSGGKVILGPNTRIRVRSFEQADDAGFYSLEILLIRGSLTGDASQGSGSSNFTIRTTGGVSNVTGSKFAVTFTPSGAVGGTLNVASTSGLPTVTPAGTTAPVTVQPGTAATIAPGAGAPQVADLSPTKIAAINTAVNGGNPAPGSPPSLTEVVITGTALHGATPDTTQLFGSISPNGEGSF